MVHCVLKTQRLTFVEDEAVHSMVQSYLSDEEVLLNTAETLEPVCAVVDVTAAAGRLRSLPAVLLRE